MIRAPRTMLSAPFSRSVLLASLLSSTFAWSQSVSVIPRAPSRPTTELAARVDRVADAFRGRGARPLLDRWTTFLREGAAGAFDATVSRPQCLGFVAVGREGLSDIDLVIVNGAGVEVARDDRRDAHPYARVCLTSADTLHVRAQATRGVGELSVLTIASPPLVSPPLDEVLGVRPTSLFAGPRAPRAEVGRDPAAVSATEFLDRLVTRHLEQGLTRVGEVRSGSLEHQQTTQTTVTLSEGRCYVVQGAGGDHVDDLDLRILSPTRIPLAQDVGLDARPALRLCAPIAGEYTLDVRMFSGSGEWAVQTLEIPATVPHRLGEDVVGVERARALEIAGEAARRSLEPSADAVRGAAWMGPVVPFAVTLRAGRCYVFGAAGDERVAALDLWLADETGAVLAADTNERERAVVYHCARRDRSAVANVRAQAGRGEYVFQSFESGSSPP